MAYRMQRVPYRAFPLKIEHSPLASRRLQCEQRISRVFSVVIIHLIPPPHLYLFLLHPVTAQHRRKFYMVRYHHVGSWFGMSIPDVSTSSPLVSREIYYPKGQSW